MASPEVSYGPDGPAEHELKLIGDVNGKRVLDLGCADGAAAVALARQGAVVIAIDPSSARLAQARRLAEEREVRVECRAADLADLAFMRADSVDLVFSAFAVDTVDDAPRVFRQAQRVLKPNAPFVFSHQHPFVLSIEGGRIVRSYTDAGPVTTSRWGETVTVYPHSLSATFTHLLRSGFRVDAFHETGMSDGNVPSTVVWRARKEGT